MEDTTLMARACEMVLDARSAKMKHNMQLLLVRMQL